MYLIEYCLQNNPCNSIRKILTAYGNTNIFALKKLLEKQTSKETRQINYIVDLMQPSKG